MLLYRMWTNLILTPLWRLCDVRQALQNKIKTSVLFWISACSFKKFKSSCHFCCSLNTLAWWSAHPRQKCLFTNICWWSMQMCRPPTEWGLFPNKNIVLPLWSWRPFMRHAVMSLSFFSANKCQSEKAWVRCKLQEFDKTHNKEEINGKN